MLYITALYKPIQEKFFDLVIRSLPLLLLLSLINTSNAQELNPKFYHITTSQGLSHSNVTCIVKDSKGFMWFGTPDGLNRYDGYSTVIYRNNPKDPESLVNSHIKDILEDSNGNLWICTIKGLSYYVRSTDSFTNFRHDPKDPNSITPSALHDLHLDKNGIMWIGTYDAGLVRLDTKTKTFTNYRRESNNSSTLSSDEIFHITEDKSGFIWMATSNGLNRLDKKTNNITHYNNDPDDPYSISANFCSSVWIDKDDNVWVGTDRLSSPGINFLDKRTNKFTRYGHDDTNKNSLCHNSVEVIEGDNKGNLWIGTRNGGISVLNVATRKITNYKEEDGNVNSLNNNSIHSLYADNLGNMWIGTYTGGVNVVDKNIKRFTHYKSDNTAGGLSNNNFLSVTQGVSGVWIGTDGGGINLFDPVSGKFKGTYKSGDGKTGLHDNYIMSLCEDADHILWVGTLNTGVNRIYQNGETKAFSSDETPESGISSNTITKIIDDNENNLWVGSWGGGLNKMDKKSEKFTVFEFNPNDPSSLSDNVIFSIYKDSKHNIWIGTEKGGLNLIDQKSNTFTRFMHDENNPGSLSQNTVNIIFEDSRGNLWIGTNYGLNLFNEKTKTFSVYKAEDGLPNNVIQGILEDDHQNLWLSTNNGICKFNPEKKISKSYFMIDGLQGNDFKRGACLKLPDRRMIFGGNNGFNIFHPDSITDNKFIPPVVITAFQLFNKTVSSKTDSTILSYNVTETDQIKLSYKHSVFSFEFAALNFTLPEKNQYAYKMDGFDNDWNYIGTKRTATYTNLNPGRYVFRVIASNNDGIWNEKGISIEVVISPPWWGTWWFRFIVAFSLISIIAYIVYSRLQHFKNQKILLEKLVAQKTSELQQMNTMLVKQADELNVTNSLLEKRKERIEEQSEELMAQKESLVSMNNELYDLNATKDKFFSIIAHDIKNPFNAILGFTELLEENFKEWTDEMKLEIITLVLNSSRNLYQLLENLLQWSRSQRGIIEFVPQKIELKDSIQNVIDLMKGTAEAKNIELGFTLSEIGLAVNADRQMLDTIIRNLVNNALKFTNTGGKVRITAEMIDGYVNIEVIDNGVGMKSDIKDKLFKIDSNHTTTGTANEIGSGLGLILVKEFVTRHGGEIGVDSIPGEGSTFHFTLPITK